MRAVGSLAPGATVGELGRVLGEASVPAPGVGEDAEIAVAGPLWVRAGMPVREAFERAARDVPGGAVHAADFAGDREGVRRRINTEIEKVTRGRVRELVGAGDLQPDTLAALVSALWLRIAWADAFSPRMTRPLPFHTPDRVREPPTMTRQGLMEYAEADGWTIVSLPGTGGPVMDVLVPGGNPGAPATPPTAPTVARLLGARRSTEVRLFLPRFAVEASLDMIPPLRAAGVRRVFTDASDLSGISPWRVKIGKVAHRAVLEAGESGLEGAAATLVIAAPGSAAPPPRAEPVVVQGDRPFLDLVRHAGAILFLAWIAYPAGR